MSVSHADFYNSVSSLIGSTYEMERRNYASRVYYSAFHIARNLTCINCPDIQFPTEAEIKQLKLSSHPKVIFKLTSAAAKSDVLKYKINKIGSRLKQMKAIREHADYELSGYFETKECNEQNLLHSEISRLCTDVVNMAQGAA